MINGRFWDILIIALQARAIAMNIAAYIDICDPVATPNACLFVYVMRSVKISLPLFINCFNLF